MGNVTLNYTGGNQNVVRAYIKGFTVQSGVTNLALSGQILSFDYSPALLHWDLRISDEFYPASSNVYSLDHVFDLPNCFSYVGGVLTPTSINFGLMYVPGEIAFRLGTLPGAAGDPSWQVDLPVLSDYWLPS